MKTNINLVYITNGVMKKGRKQKLEENFNASRMD